MKVNKLNNGQKMPSVGLGTWLAEENQVYNIVKEAIKLGYRHIDCAAIYENEEEIGRALSEVFSEGIIKREELFITSKLWNNSHAKEDVIPALKKTLADLQLDYLDLYLIHWPVAFKKDVGFASTPDEYIPLEELPIIETYNAMEEAIDLGLVRSIGVSNFSKKKLEDLIVKARVKPVVNQVELHPYLSQNELLEYCNKENIALTCYSPLGSTGRPAQMKADNEPSLLTNEVIQKISEKHRVSPAQVILNWSLKRGTIVIPKTVTPKRAKENLDSQNFEMNPEDYKEIDKLDMHFRIVTGKFFTPEGGPYTYENIWDEEE